MVKPKVDLLDVIKTRFLVKLGPKLKARQPLIAAITSIKIEKITKTKNGQRFDYRATIEGLDRNRASFNFVLEHQEECIWVYVK